MCGREELALNFKKWIFPSVLKLFVEPFQDELQEAISAHAAREQTAEYSDDFDSDEDAMLNSKTQFSIFPHVPPFLNSLQDQRESLWVSMI